ncbi:nuclear transport factor 2 family protein [Salinimicrobium catena]|uniref:YybH family protein n=1 Tax=Salinimicrobium catena TaxID=390640 RepID=UPI002FE451A6
MKNVFTLLSLGLLFFGSVQAQSSGNSSDKVKAYILEAGEKMEQALANKDAEKFGSYFADDAFFKLSGQEALHGQQAVIQAHKGMVANGLKLNINAEEVHSFGNYAAEIGNYEITSPDGQVIDKGTYSTLWKKNGNEWKIYRDIVSTSMK